MDYRPALVDDIPWLTEMFVDALRRAITAERGWPTSAFPPFN
jgi:hypothetical protein